MRKIRKAVLGYEIEGVEEEIKELQEAHESNIQKLNDEISHLRADNEIMAYVISTKDAVEHEVPMSAYMNAEGPFLKNASDQMMNIYHEQTMTIADLQKKIEALHEQHKKVVAEKEAARLETLSMLQTKLRETIQNL